MGLLCRRRFGPKQAVMLALLVVILVAYKVYLDHHWMHHVLDVIIVEEHHEVLPYWHRASWAGKLRERHNTLLHIDAHSDMAPPQLAPSFPLFRLAESMKEVRALMQRNDVFIMGSMISGLVHRVAWSWPSWDVASHETEYLHQTLDIGLIEKPEPRREENEAVFCICATDRKGKECTYMNYTDQEDYTVSDKACGKGAHGVYEIIKDSATLSKLVSGNWFPSPMSSSTSSFILDIDLDFFGTENPAEILRRESGLEWDVIDKISQLVRKTFCPITVAGETESDRLLGSLIDLVVIDCKTPVGQDGGIPVGDSPDGVCEMVLKDVHTFMDGFIQRTVDTNLQLLCSGDKPALLKRVDELTGILTQLSKWQLEALQQIGFCLQCSPKTLGFEYMPGIRDFGLCTGANPPNDSAVTNHYSTTNEINSNMKLLQRILSTRKFPTPGVVTIARSMRDGYTSKKHFDLIEDSLIHVIKQSFPEKQIRIVYDEDLMGGPEGRRWNKRLAHKMPKSGFWARGL